MPKVIAFIAARLPIRNASSARALPIHLSRPPTSRPFSSFLIQPNVLAYAEVRALLMPFLHAPRQRTEPRVGLSLTPVQAVAPFVASLSKNKKFLPVIAIFALFCRNPLFRMGNVASCQNHREQFFRDGIFQGGIHFLLFENSRAPLR
jgi:hypothetical protein